MPFVEIKMIEGELSKEEIKKLVEDVTNAVVSNVGENLRSVIWVTVQEIKSDYFGVGGQCIGLKEIRAMQAGSTEE
ncbi:MAG TPA: tautomerase family protein [Methanosarcina vacuolata]|jgi:4-oxalocrotonate tautomerase|nr:tautomerase family protein [Methanosarcina vacuolata]HPS90394.1 tautomerase family protein [Methanosarcina vacuolata]